jgi:hypothetical protein
MVGCPSVRNWADSTRDRIHALMREKYGTADRLVGVLRDPAQSVPVRLESLGAGRE